MTTEKKFKDAGLGAWQGKGFSLESAEAWRKAGFTVREAQRWNEDFVKKCKTATPKLAGIYKVQGWTAEQAQEEERRLGSKNKQPITATNPKGAGPPPKYSANIPSTRWQVRAWPVESQRITRAFDRREMVEYLDAEAKRRLSDGN